MTAALQWIVVTLGWLGGIVMLVLAIMFIQDVLQKQVMLLELYQLKVLENQEHS